MKQRERFMKLLREAEAKCANTGQCRLCEQYGKGGDCQRELTTDYLLANGALCPPCKVGDTVYEIQRIRQRVQAYEVTSVKHNGKYFWFTWVLKDGVGVYGNAGGFTDLQLCKTVFFSREEAEKALERSNT